MVPCGKPWWGVVIVLGKNNPFSPLQRLNGRKGIGDKTMSITINVGQTFKAEVDDNGVALGFAIDNPGVPVEVKTATKVGDNYLDENGAKLDKTPRPLGNKLYAIMPDRESEGYALYVDAVKMIKAERIVPGRMDKTRKALVLTTKTLNPKLVKILKFQGESMKSHIDKYVKELYAAIDANVNNNQTETPEVTFNWTKTPV
jgi:hypothetical protein